MLAWIAMMALAAGGPDEDNHGPIIDTHAHIRLGDGDAVRSDQGVGPDAIIAVDKEAEVSLSAAIVIARAGQIEKNRAQNDAVIAAAKASSGISMRSHRSILLTGRRRPLSWTAWLRPA